MLQGKLLADFSSFQDAVEKADVQLKGMETGASKVSASLSRMTDSLSGRKLVSDATLAAEAVERIGGTSKLTSAELARVQAQATAASDKLRAMGQDVPPGIQKIADTAKTSTSSLDGMKTAMLGAFSIAAVSSAITKFTDFTGSLTDMAAKTGIGTSELQKLKFAAEQNGGTLEGVTGGITKMAKALVEGKDSTVSAMQRLGLSIDSVRNMEPGAAFSTIADAIAKVPNPLERSKLAMDLFGKSGADLLPVMTGNLSETMKAAERLGIVMDEQTVAAGDNLGDTLSALQSVGMGLLGRVLAPMLPALQMAADAMLKAGGIVDWLGLAFDALERVALMTIKTLVDGAIAVGTFAGKIPGLSKVLGDDAAAMQSMKDASTFLGNAITEVEKGTSASTVAVKKHVDAVVGLPDLHEKTAKAIKSHTEAAQANTQITELLAKAHAHATSELKLEETQYKNSQHAVENYLKHLPTANLQLVEGVKNYSAIVPLIGEAAMSTGNLASAQREATKTTGEWAAAMKTGVDGLLGTVAQTLKKGGSFLQGLKDFGMQTATEFVSGMLGAIPGIGPMLQQFAGPLVDGFKKLGGVIAGMFDRNKGRDIVEDFVSGFGGFDQFHALLGEKLPADAERLWKLLTQGVGRNNPAEAKKAIDEINGALDAQTKKQAEAGTAATKAAEAEMAAFTAAQQKAKDVVKDLDTQIKSLEDSIANEAPEEVMGVVEAQTRARIAGLKEERDAAQKSLEALTSTMTDSIKDVASAIRDLPKEIAIELKVSTASVSGLSGGGRVLPFATGGFVPRGTDTVPALLTPGEEKLSTRCLEALAPSSEGSERRLAA